MLWFVTSITFLGTVTILIALFYAFSQGETGVSRRLERVLDRSVPSSQDALSQKGVERVRGMLASVGSMFPSSPVQVSRSQLMMIRAGIRRPDAMLAMRGVRLLVPVGLVAAVFFSGYYRANPFFIFLLTAVVGYMIPETWLLWRIRSRQHKFGADWRTALTSW